MSVITVTTSLTKPGKLFSSDGIRSWKNKLNFRKTKHLRTIFSQSLNYERKTSFQGIFRKDLILDTPRNLTGQTWHERLYTRGKYSLFKKTNEYQNSQLFQING